MEITGNFGTSPVAGMEVSNLDIETLLLSVQYQRSELLHNQLKQQMDTVKHQNDLMAQKNQQITTNQENIGKLAETNAKLGAEISELTELRNRLEASKCPDPNGWYGLAYAENDDGPASYELLEKVKKAGCTIPTGADAPQNIDGNHTMDAKGKVVAKWVEELDKKIEAKQKQIDANNSQKGKLENENDAINRDIDSLSSSQQLDMLRLQSLSNKYNEAFDLMSNFMKKMQDNRSNIVASMR